MSNFKDVKIFMKTFLLLVCTFFPSSLRLIVWRFFGFKVGNNVHVSIFSVVVADFINIGSGAAIDSLSFIYRPSNLIIGKRARVGSFIRIIGREGNVNLGSQSAIVMGCLIDSTGNFTLGSKSQIGPKTMIYTHGDSSLSFNQSMQVFFHEIAHALGVNHNDCPNSDMSVSVIMQQDGVQQKAGYSKERDDDGVRWATPDQIDTIGQYYNFEEPV